MINLKMGKKQMLGGSSSASHPISIDDSSSLSEDSNCRSISSKKQIYTQSKVMKGKKPAILINNDIDGLLECPVCNSAMFPPIQQCPSGHTLCSSCKSKVYNKCPICRKEIGDIRCLALEKLACSLHLPCVYHHFGCGEMYPYYNKLRHEVHCAFRPYICPHPGSDCPFTGDIPALLSHLQENHKVDLQTGCTFNHRYVKQDPCSVDNVSWTLTLFNCFGQYFCLHFEAFLLGREPVYMAFVRFIGEESEARKFGYSLEVGGNGRKLTWHGVPRSIRAHHGTVRDSHDGLIVQRSLALYFSGGDQELKLRVTGRIWRDI
ncbi:E3 ubiquitin-protein ligase DIS1-like isoform X1 [Typha angustifolia]|uniref:E3 ubiquitin-protein ligase DIS1-like isoform X1 n=1 Tax=Typha angustifolia TaxID=59011 RepID=UPI003C2D074A